MKYVLLLAGSFLAVHAATAQKTEYSAHLVSGGMAYRGASAAATTSIDIPDIVGYKPSTLNAYGKRLGFSYGLAGQVQRLTKGGSLWGAQAGYEMLRSRVNIQYVFSESSADPKAEGHTNLNHQFITTHVFFGHRFAVSGLGLDLTGGPEVGFLQKVHEKGRATYNNDQAEITVDRARNVNTKADVRARLNLTAYYHRVGLALSYAHGLTNYRQHYLGGTNELYTQVLRAGLVYRLK
ncbi:hypothetical protein SAMN06265337_2487 [Hymenobacter gelipurpurascens]|uniref:Outer membrane protein beta-barrel domain-containing protein n=1 Tax=Hymenobacter gelipurpurascens TaxID=89968 RepID=A0A212U944_9BACT|nr:outer membrane beta-barrel protein [Hymenobacter gelipurpurascens]SNC74670.1 hypothetical protein SAMN06265337_2487 [Hymenobacter gelipurpurascens]